MRPFRRPEARPTLALVAAGAAVLTLAACQSTVSAR